MNYEEALNYIHTIPKFRRPLGNMNLSGLLSALGNPQKKLKFVHIAGTNGKGSTAAMTARILTLAGCKTGLFTSPFLEVFNERIRIDGEYITDGEIAAYTGRVKDAMEKSDMPVSEFAFITAMAFLYFCEKNCDVVVLEVGMGGKLDATNVIEESVVSAICKIGLDHTQYLGAAIEEIAREKCGIIKDGGTVVSYPNYGVMDIIKATAAEKSAALTVADKARITENGFIYKGKEYALSLRGAYQPQNAAVALEIINAMRKKGFNIPEYAVCEGLKTTKWAARFEFVTNDIIIDGGHNIDGMRALKRSLASLGRDVTLVIAMMEDKDYMTCIREIAPAAKTVVATQLDMERCLAAPIIYDIVTGMNILCFVNTNPEDALSLAMSVSDGGVVCVCGSLFLAGEARKKIFENKK